jgi:hypothetical protein
VQWTGYVVAPTTDAYTFTVNASDGVRLTINGTTVLDTWSNSSTAISSSTPVTMMANSFTAVTLAYRSRSMNAEDRFCKLLWAAGSSAATVVPTTALFYERHIDGSPMEVRFVSGEVDASTSIAAGNGSTTDGLVHGIALAEHTFTIQARDSVGNNRIPVEMTSSIFMYTV